MKVGRLRRALVVASMLPVALVSVEQGSTARSSPIPLGHRFASETPFGSLPGWSLAASERRFVVGDPGSRRVFVHDLVDGEWRLQSAFRVPDVWKVAVLGDRIAVGDSGVVFLYDWDGSAWRESATLSPSQARGDFGLHGLSLMNDRVVVGAAYRNPNSVFVFDWDGTTWNETILVTPDRPRSIYLFGYDVDAGGDRIVVGAPWDPPAEAGAVYVFDWDGATWHATKLVASDRPRGQLLGVSVAVSGDRVVGGAPYGGASAYVFDLGEPGHPQTKLAPHVPAGRFGRSVDVEGDRVSVGAPDADALGAAFVYDLFKGSWVETAIAPSRRSRLFGLRVALSSGRLVASSLSSLASEGEVYVYEFFEEYSPGRCVVLPRPAGVACP